MMMMMIVFKCMSFDKHKPIINNCQKISDIIRSYYIVLALDMKRDYKVISTNKLPCCVLSLIKDNKKILNFPCSRNSYSKIWTVK